MLRPLPALPGGVSGPGFPWLGRWHPQVTRSEQRLCRGLGGPIRSAGILPPRCPVADTENPCPSAWRWRMARRGQGAAGLPFPIVGTAVVLAPHNRYPGHTTGHLGVPCTWPAPHRLFAGLLPWLGVGLCVHPTPDLAFVPRTRLPL